MKKLFALFALMLILTSCEPKEVREGRGLYKLYLRHILVDPNSLQIYNEKYEIEEDCDVLWTIDYGAKNQAGGMVRKTVRLRTTGDDIIKNMDKTKEFYFREDLE